MTVNFPIHEIAMCEKYVLVESKYSSKDIIYQHFQTTSIKRIKFTCFDISKKYIVFGANSGGIYVFRRKHTQKLLQIIPNQNGSATIVSICDTENNIAIGTSKGIVCILSDFSNFQLGQDTNYQQQLHGEHEGNIITCLKWSGNELYSGDNIGNVAITSPVQFLNISFFQSVSTCLLQLESGIVQIDVFTKYLLVSTETRVVLCDTERETYKQIGRKLRNGQFGACFCLINHNAEVSSVSDAVPCIFSARPGIRLWQSDLNGSVLFTHQFRNNLININRPSNIIQFFPETSNKHNIVQISSDKTVTDCSHYNNGRAIEQNDVTFDHLQFNFSKLFIIRNKFIISFTKNAIYIFDPFTTNSLLMWCKIDHIRDIRIDGCDICIWQYEYEVRFICLYDIEETILIAFFSKYYYACSELCVNYSQHIIENSTKQMAHVLNVLLTKLDPVGDQETITKLKHIVSQQAELSIVNADDAIISTKIVTNKDDDVHLVNNINYNIKINYNHCRFEEDNLYIIYQQYTLNQVHSSLETPKFTALLKALTCNQLVDILMDFIDLVDECDQDVCKKWCYNTFLACLNQDLHSVNLLAHKALQFAKEAYIDCNSTAVSNGQIWKAEICECCFPLPSAKYSKPALCQLARSLMNILPDIDQRELTRNFPFLYKYSLTAMKHWNDSDVALLIQFNDVETLSIVATAFTFDLWEKCIRDFLKLTIDGQCLNCNRNVCIENVMPFNNFAILLFRLTDFNTSMKLLQQYSNEIAVGKLSASFYQYCIVCATMPSYSIQEETLNMFNNFPLCYVQSPNCNEQ